MSEKSINWKIRVQKGEVEIEVVGLTPDISKKWFDELAKKYLLD